MFHFVRRRSRNSAAASSTMNTVSNNDSHDMITPTSLRSNNSRSSSNHRISRSPSRISGTSPNNIPKALRILRLLLYSIAAPNFIYSMYVQLIVLKGPGRTPLPASINFGRDTLFLTFHGNFHCTWYACLCLLHSFLSLGPLFNKRRNNKHAHNNNVKPRRTSYAARTVEHLTHRFTSILFPLSTFIGLAYYLILHFHPLNRLRAKVVPDHDSKMALLHLNPLLFILFDSWLKDSDLLLKHGLKKRKATRVIIIYGIVYFIWTTFCVIMNGGHWPYPFQKSFSAIQHIMFVLCCILFTVYLCRTGFTLHGRLDRRRRRRLALVSERSSSTTNNNNNNTGVSSNTTSTSNSGVTNSSNRILVNDNNTNSTSVLP